MLIEQDTNEHYATVVENSELISQSETNDNQFWEKAHASFKPDKRCT